VHGDDERHPADAYPDSDSDADSDAYPDADADAYADSDSDADAYPDADGCEVVHGDVDGGEQLAGWVPGWCEREGWFGGDQWLVDVVHDRGYHDLEQLERDTVQLGFDVHGEERVVERCACRVRVHQLRVPGCGHRPDRDRRGELHGELNHRRGFGSASMTA
jgi:hypothetical protein